MESRQNRNLPDSAINLPATQLAQIKQVFGGDGLRLFNAAVGSTRRLNWIGKAAAASHSNLSADPLAAVISPKTERSVRRRIDEVRQQSGPARRAWLYEATAALSRFHRTLRLRLIADNYGPPPVKISYSLDTTKRSLVSTPDAVFQSEEGIGRDDLRASLDDLRRRPIDHIVPKQHVSREGGMTSNAPRFSRNKSTTQRAIAGTRSIDLGRSAHPRVANAAQMIRRLGAMEPCDDAKISGSSRGRIERALAMALKSKIPFLTNIYKNAASVTGRSDNSATDGPAAATEGHHAHKQANDLVRKSPVSAITRLLRATGLSNAAKKEPEPAAPSRPAIAEGARVVVNFSPTFEFAEGADQKQIEQAVADALASRIPEVLRRLRDEWANRRRVAFT